MPFDRRIILLVVGLALISVAWIGSSHQPIEQPSTGATPAEAKREILVAKQTLNPGTIVTDDKIEWSIRSGAISQLKGISRDQNSEGENPYLGRLVVKSIAQGEPLLVEHFASGDTVNYIAEKLQPGKRAYAISIDTKGTVTAGNFILPNDRVDIIRSYNSNMGLQSETILSNIRVLAVGQIVHGEGLSTAGDTATVEVDLHDAEILATAQRTGQISLALRNPSDTETEGSQAKRILVIRPSPLGDKTL